MRHNLFIILVSTLFTVLLQSQEKQPVNEKEYFNQEFLRYKKLFEYQQKSSAMTGESFDVTYYKINIEVTTEPHYITGEVEMDAVNTVGDLTAITLDIMNSLAIDSVKAGGVSVSFVQHASSVDITLDRSYGNGELFTVTIFYQGVPGSSGFGSFEFSSHSGIPWVWSLSEPYGAKDWWPCKDHPSDKADSADIIVTCNSAFKVGSNGKLISVTDNGNGTVTYFWKEQYPISTYLISVAITNYAEFSNWFRYSPTDSMEVLNYVLPENLASAQAGLPRAVDGLEIFSELFGLYPFINEKYGHSQFGWGGGMEHQTMTSLGGFSEGLVIHELAHQWFGDMITCRTWPDLWLNEGFATYCEALYNEKKYGTSDYWNSINYEINSAKSAADSLHLGDTSNVGYMFSYSRVYAKGAVVLHMLRHVLGDSLFFLSLYNYANDPRYKYGTASTEDLKGVCESTSGLDLDYFFDEWVFGEGYPRYAYTWISQPDGGQYLVSVTIQQSNPTSNPPYFTMPVDLKVSASGWDTTVTVFNNAIDQTFDFYVSHDPNSVELDPEGWIMKGVAAGNISVNPQTKYFGDVVIGAGKTDSVMVTNLGTAPVTVNASSDHSDYTVNPSSFLMVPSANKRFYITFTPSVYGNRAGTIIFTYPASGSPQIVIVSGNGVDPTISYQMIENWDIVSVPLTVADLRKSVIFQTAVSDAFGYDKGTGNYVPKDTLAYGAGYWIKFGSSQLVNIQGALRETDTVDIVEGWNLIGSISVPVPTSTVVKEPSEMIISEFFGFDGTYFISDSILPSKGYWIKADRSGKLILNNSAVISGSIPLRSQFELLHKLIVSDARGYNQTLYFGESSAGRDRLTQEFPPLPPEGVFDVRFGTGSIVGELSASDQGGLPVEIRSAGLPIKIEWDIDSRSANYSFITDDRIIELAGQGEVYLDRYPVRSLLKISDRGSSSLPEVFRLEQNYPNPFNPNTRVYYGLPADCHVTLRIYDMIGREVATVLDEFQKAGYREVDINAENFTSGIYFYKMTAGGSVDVKKMLLVR